MIGRVYRGHGTAGLIRYLYGPARAESPVAHHDPHLVASWLGHGPEVLAALEPVPLADLDVDVDDDTAAARLGMTVAGRGLSAGATRAAAQLAAAGGQGSVWDAPDARSGVLPDVGDGLHEGAGRRPAVPGPVDARHLVRALEAPLREQQRAAKRGGPAPAAEHVWHVALRNPDGDRRLSDAEWAQVAADVVHRTGLSRRGPDGRPVEGGCPWVAVRHDDTSIHLVVVLAREDGRAVRLWRDYRQLREVCLAAEQTYRLTVTAPADRTADTHTTRAEVEKATRLAATAGQVAARAATVGAGAGPQMVGVVARPAASLPAAVTRRGVAEPARDQLRRHVQAVAAASGSEREFFARLERGGLLVHRRWSTRQPGQVTGYAVALPPVLPSAEPAGVAGATESAPQERAAGVGGGGGTGQTGGGAPVFFGGGKLAPDLTLPQLRQRWTTPQPTDARPVVAPAPRQPVQGDAAADAWRQASAAVAAARAAVDGARSSGATLDQQDQAAGAAWAAADLLTVTARLLEGPGGQGPLSAAARAYGRAARPARLNPAVLTQRAEPGSDSFDRVRPRQGVGQAGSGLRLAASMLGAAGRADGDVATMLRLVAQVADLVEVVQGLREAQRRVAQAGAARAAAASLHTAGKQYAPVAGVDAAAATTVTAAATVGARAAAVPRSVAEELTAALRAQARQQPGASTPGRSPRRPGPLPPTAAPPSRGLRR